MNKQMMSRLVFLVIFGLVVFGIFILGKGLSKSEESALGGTAVESFMPSEKGKAVLVEFSDFQCPACAMYYPVVRQLKSEFEGKLTVVYKHFPLMQIHRNANLAARASEAALAQGKFWEMHNMLFDKQDEWKDSGQALSLFTAYAESFGMDKERFLDDIDSSAIYDKVNKEYQEGSRLKVAGTPTFFLNGKKINNPRNYDEFKKLIEQAISE